MSPSSLDGMPQFKPAHLKLGEDQYKDSRQPSAFTPTPAWKKTRLPIRLGAADRRAAVLRIRRAASQRDAGAAFVMRSLRHGVRAPNERGRHRFDETEPAPRRIPGGEHADARV